MSKVPKKKKKKCSCKKCNDTKLIVCPICYGTGSTLDNSGYRICFCCDGKLVIPCPKCADVKE